tara:strand:+ start:290 stop:505 length:216 start_codon:yes stop_codon:yes gene_type:complete
MFSRSKEELKLIAACGPSSKVTQPVVDGQITILFTTMLDGNKYGIATPMGVDKLTRVLESMHKAMAGLIRK